MWMIKFKFLLHAVGYRAVLTSGFETVLPTTEAKVFDLTKQAKEAKRDALKKYYKATDGLILVFEPPEITNKSSRSRT